MPTYDYICSNCRQRTEVIHGINSSGPRTCPACGAAGTMRKALTTPAVHFKGSGWAKKDRSSASAARTKAAASTSSSDGGGTDGGASEAKTADKGTPAAEPAPKSTGTAGSSDN